MKEELYTEKDLGDAFDKGSLVGFISGLAFTMVGVMLSGGLK